MKASLEHLEPFRERKDRVFGTEPGDRRGLFRWNKGKTYFKAVLDDGALPEDPAHLRGWEHVSLTVAYLTGRKFNNRMPTWEEMCALKDMFFEPEEAVMQLHPPASDYVNMHKHCLHLWRPILRQIPLPPSILVGPPNKL